MGTAVSSALFPLVTMFSHLFLLFFFFSAIEGNQSVQQLEEIKLGVKSDLADMEARFKRKQEEMETRIDRMEAQCIKVEKKVKEKETNEKKLEEHINKVANKINRELQSLEEKVDIWEKKEKKVKDSLENKLSELSKKIEVSDNSLQSQILKIQSEGVLPYVMVCAYQFSWDVSNSTISYDRILSEFQTGGDGEMDLSTGVFTAGISGYYQVTLSGWVNIQSYGGEYYVFLYKNGKEMFESKWGLYIGSGDQHVYYTGSRTLIVHLAAGEELDVRAGLVVDAVLYQLVTCISLQAADPTKEIN